MNLKSAFNRFRGHPVETDIARYARIVAKIRALHEEKQLVRASDAEIAGLAASLRLRLAGAPPRPKAEEAGGAEDARVEAFALVLEATRRATGLDAHDVQVIAALAMADGKIAELPTGEGKTLAAVFTASSFALAGRPVHILTFNDYLARRDAAWMGPAYRLLGLSVGAAQEGMDKPAKRAAYACDVTYATAKEAGFDYLRDRLAFEPGELVHRTFAAALVDEADSILIDEARIPLVISGTAGASGVDASRLAAVVRRARARPRLRDRRRERQRLSHGRRHPPDRNASPERQPLRPGERDAPRRGPLRPPRPAAPRAGRRLHRPRRPDRDRRRVHRPGHGQAPLAGRAPGRRRSQRGRAARGRGTHPRLDHPPALLPALSDALRHDGHGRAVRAGDQGVLRPRRRGRAAAPAVRASRHLRRRFHPQGRQVRGARPGDRRASTPRAGPSSSARPASGNRRRSPRRSPGPASPAKSSTPGTTSSKRRSSPGPAPRTR